MSEGCGLRKETGLAGPTSVEDYLAALPEEQRAALEKLRKTIRVAAPEATETISYQMPAFKNQGRFLVSYAAFKDHCSFFPASNAVMREEDRQGADRGERSRETSLRQRGPGRPGGPPPDSSPSGPTCTRAIRRGQESSHDINRRARRRHPWSVGTRRLVGPVGRRFHQAGYEPTAPG